MDESDDNTVGAVVLGAGMSSRFGEANKLLEPVDGTPVLTRVVHTAVDASIDNVVVVLGDDADRVAQTLHGLPVTTVYNDDYAAGQSSSVRRGIEFATGADWDAAVVMLGDMPFVEPDTVDRLVATYRAEAKPIVAPRHDGRRGNPVLFDRSQFEQLLEVSGDRGGRELVRTHPDTVLLDTDDSGVCEDIDTEGDLPRDPR